MKTIFLLVFVLVTVMLSGCTGKTDTQQDSTSSAVQDSNSSVENDIKYIDVSADWPVYENTDALIKAANVVILGKVTGISFQILDLKNGGSPTEDSEQQNCAFCTIYDVEVDTSYKGNAAGKLRFCTEGGLKGEYVKEQLAVLDGSAKKEIPVMVEMPKIEIDETYLFVLYQYEDKMPTLLNPEQGIYKLDNPLEKDVYSYVSPKEIISYFGEEQWEAFISENSTSE